MRAGHQYQLAHRLLGFSGAVKESAVRRFATRFSRPRREGSRPVDLEFPSWTETPNLTEATRVLRAADQSNAGLLIDVLHFARSRSRVDELRELPPEWFHYAHVCDAPGDIPTTTAGLIHTARFERLFRGEGDLDILGILSALPEGIPYALEIPRAELVAQVGPKEHTRLAISAARGHLDAAVVRRA